MQRGPHEGSVALNEGNFENQQTGTSLFRIAVSTAPSHSEIQDCDWPFDMHDSSNGSQGRKTPTCQLAVRQSSQSPSEVLDDEAQVVWRHVQIPHSIRQRRCSSSCLLFPSLAPEPAMHLLIPSTRRTMQAHANGSTKRAHQEVPPTQQARLQSVQDEACSLR